MFPKQAWLHTGSLEVKSPSEQANPGGSRRFSQTTSGSKATVVDSDLSVFSGAWFDGVVGYHVRLTSVMCAREVSGSNPGRTILRGCCGFNIGGRTFMRPIRGGGYLHFAGSDVSRKRPSLVLGLVQQSAEEYNSSRSSTGLAAATILLAFLCDRLFLPLVFSLLLFRSHHDFDRRQCWQLSRRTRRGGDHGRGRRARQRRCWRKRQTQDDCPARQKVPRCQRHRVHVRPKFLCPGRSTRLT